MILEKQTEAHILQEGESQDSVKMSLDLDSAQVLMQMMYAISSVSMVSQPSVTAIQN